METMTLRQFVNEHYEHLTDLGFFYGERHEIYTRPHLYKFFQRIKEEYGSGEMCDDDRYIFEKIIQPFSLFFYNDLIKQNKKVVEFI